MRTRSIIKKEMNAIREANNGVSPIGEADTIIIELLLDIRSLLKDFKTKGDGNHGTV